MFQYQQEQCLVLYGTVTCYSGWQITILLFGIFYAIPFPFVLVLAMSLLKRGKIPSVTFVSCCLCPLIALCVIFIHWSNGFLDHTKKEIYILHTQLATSLLSNQYHCLSMLCNSTIRWR